MLRGKERPLATYNALLHLDEDTESTSANVQIYSGIDFQLAFPMGRMFTYGVNAGPEVQC